MERAEVLGSSHMGSPLLPAHSAREAPRPDCPPGNLANPFPVWALLALSRPRPQAGVSPEAEHPAALLRPDSRRRSRCSPAALGPRGE
ncbi:hypothetical protein TREES_T100011833 [Tupaia chinensis]|uniref:Uncharacterized protein n=1 Tax=Tupaia chinensis TaxID=246437 RepID=L9KYP6_TUPCH|nr:hypothetical protein TREES_T100011833 [Tupaia chinensis]